MIRTRDYSIIRFLTGALYVVAVLLLLGAIVMTGVLWLRAEMLRSGEAPAGPFNQALDGFDSHQLYIAAGATAAIGVVGFLLFGAFGQILAMLRDRAVNATYQVQLLQDILELNEEDPTSTRRRRVDLCEGCGRLAAVEAIQSGQWVCRECRRQMRSS